MRTFFLTISVIAAAAAGAWAADAKAGKAAYDTSCKSCHGPDGAPVAAVAKMMKVEMLDLKSPEVQKMSDPEIAGIITKGKGKMQPAKAVTGKAVDDVVAYVRSLKK